MVNRRGWGIAWGGILLSGLVMASGVGAAETPPVSEMPCASAQVESTKDFLSKDSTATKWLFKKPLSTYLVKNSYYALCLNTAKIGTFTLPIIIDNKLGFPVLIDGLNMALPNSVNPTQPALTVMGTSPVLVRNSTVTGADAPGSTGIVVGGQPVGGHGLAQVTVTDYERGIVLSGQGHAVVESVITNTVLHNQTVGIVLDGADLLVTNPTIQHFETGIRIIPNTNISVLGGSITDATVGVQVLAPLADPTADTPPPSMTLLPGKFVQVTTPFQSAQPLPEDLTNNLLMAKQCAKTMPVNDYEVCDKNAEGTTVMIIEGLLPNHYCNSASSANVLQISLYENTDVSSATNQLEMISPCQVLSTVEEKAFVVSKESVTAISAGSCVFRCEHNANGKPLQLPLEAGLQPAGTHNSRGGFLTDSPFFLAEIADSAKQKSTTAIAPVGATTIEGGAVLGTGPIGGDGAGGNVGVTAEGESDSIGAEGNEIIAALGEPDTGPSPALPLSDPSSLPEDQPASRTPPSSGGTTVAAMGGDDTAGLGMSGASFGGAAKGCTLIRQISTTKESL